MNIKVDDMSLALAVSIFKELREDGRVSEEKLEQYLETPGINFMKRHLKHYGGSDFDKGIIIHVIAKTLSNPRIEENENIFITSFKRGYSLVEILEPQYETVNLQEVIINSVDLTNKFLPEPYSGNIKIYILYGIRGTAIVLGKEIAIDICDEALLTNEGINLESLIRLISHEIHHVATEEYLDRVIEKTESIEEKNLLTFLGNLLSEGAALYYLTNPVEMIHFSSLQWRKNLSKVNELLYEAQEFIDKIVYDKSFNIQDMDCFFDENLKGYTIGYVMIKTIDERLGKEKVMECVANCKLLIKYYNEAVSEGQLELLPLSYKMDRE